MFEEDEDAEEWTAAKSVAYCAASDRDLKGAVPRLPLSVEKSVGISLASHTSN